MTNKTSLDGILARAGLGLWAINGAYNYVQNADLSKPSEFLTTLGIGAGLVGAYKLTKPGSFVSNTFGNIKKGLDKNKKVSYVKTALLGAAALAGVALSPYSGKVGDVYDSAKDSLTEIIDDTFDSKKEEPIISKTEKKTYSSGGCTREQKIQEVKVEEDTKKINSDIGSIIGKYERTLRFEDIIIEMANKYDVPAEIIFGKIMRESGGDPLRLNSVDGGFGLGQFQPGTGEDYGLENYCNSSKTGADKKCARKTQELLNQCNYDLGCVAKQDDRANPRKSIEAIAKYLTKLAKKYKNVNVEGAEHWNEWDKANFAYNAGSFNKVRFLKRYSGADPCKHVLMVKKFAADYLKLSGKISEKEYQEKIQETFELAFPKENGKYTFIVNGNQNSKSATATRFNILDKEILNDQYNAVNFKHIEGKSNLHRGDKLTINTYNKR
jgi:hypothetical protein